MRHIRYAGLCLVALVALAATSTATASAAEPAIYQCGHAAKNSEKKYTGKYTGKHCGASEKATKAQEEEGKKNKYELEEWNEGSKTEKTGKEGKVKAFKGKGAVADLEIQGVGGITCTKSADSGYFTGPKTVGKINVTFTGCVLLTHPCESTSPKASKSGEILTHTLAGTVGYISKAKDEVGVELTPETGLYEAELHCGELKLRVSGTVIGLVEPPYNVFTNKTTLLFEQSGGVQRPDELEGGGLAQLHTETGSIYGTEYGIPRLSGESTETTGQGEELELKA
jgi:hypothetical protein